MYPTVVIVLVEIQRPMMDVFEISPSNTTKPAGPTASEAHPATLGHISFAVRSVTTMMDDEAESQGLYTLQSKGGEEHVGRCYPRSKEEPGWH